MEVDSLIQYVDRFLANLIVLVLEGGAPKIAEIENVYLQQIINTKGR